MRRASEVATRAGQTADKMKEKTGRRKKSTILEVILHPAIDHGISEWDKNTD